MMGGASITILIREAYQTAVEHGWHDEPRSVGDLIALMHSELSEALEEYRAGYDPNYIYYNNNPSSLDADSKKPEGVPIELADLLIRVFDFCGRYDIDLARAIELKMIYNKTRSYRHGGKKL